LILLTKTENGLRKRVVTNVAFVPMTGEVRNMENDFKALVKQKAKEVLSK
ncbi:uncharacterized protein METZ01_LOCUS469689, partial [marine metagenome]